MPCMCGDSQCPSCGAAQGTLDPCPSCGGSGMDVDPETETIAIPCPVCSHDPRYHGDREEHDPAARDLLGSMRRFRATS